MPFTECREGFAHYAEHSNQKELNDKVASIRWLCTPKKSYNRC